MRSGPAVTQPSDVTDPADLHHDATDGVVAALSEMVHGKTREGDSMVFIGVGSTLGVG